jgi:hypothetical protein
MHGKETYLILTGNAAEISRSEYLSSFTGMIKQNTENLSQNGKALLLNSYLQFMSYNRLGACLANSVFS